MIRVFSVSRMLLKLLSRDWFALQASERYSYSVVLLYFAACCSVNREFVPSVAALVFPSST